MNALNLDTVAELAIVGELARAAAESVADQIAKWRPGVACVVRVTPTDRNWRVSAYGSRESLRISLDLPPTCPPSRASLFIRVVRAELRRSGYADR